MIDPFTTRLPKPQTVKKKFFFGNAFNALNNPVKFLENLVHEYGPLVTIDFFGTKYFVLQHHDHIKHVLLQNHKAYYKPGATKLLKLFLGDGLSTSNGALWARQRKIMQPAFHKQRLEHMVNIINEETTIFISRLQRLESSKTINITHEFLQLTISIIGRAMFSTALKEEMETLVNALEALANFASSWMRSVVKVPTGWPTPANRQFKNNCRIFDESIYGIIARRKRMVAEGSSLNGDLLDMLMQYHDDDIKSWMSEKQLRDEVTTMFMAGHETTAQTLSWTVYHIGKEKKIRQSVKEQYFKNVGDGLPTLSDIHTLTYAKQVIQETLRCYPPIWAIVRKPITDDHIYGVKIPTSANVLINVFGMHHHPGYWLTPDKFNPDHFTEEQQAQRPQFAYLPFGGGPRLCIGNNFATMVMQVVVSRLCNHFEFDIPAGYVPEAEPNITLRAKHGIQVIIKKPS